MRTKILDIILGNYPEEGFLKADGFDDAIIGIDSKGNKLVYSVSKCLNILMKDGMDFEDAYEYFYYNVEAAYVGEHTPIWVNDTFEL